MNQRLQHDCAMAMAKAILDVVASCVHPSCHKDAFEEFVAICQTGIDAYEIQVDRIQQRLHPCKN